MPTRVGNASCSFFVGVALLAGLPPFFPAEAEEPPPPAPVPENAFVQTLVPFLKAHCTECHGGEEPEAKLSLARYRESANIQDDYEVWQQVQRMLIERQMPPADEPQPSESARAAAIAAVEAEMARFDCTGVRRPGRVTLRRLNRAEYNNTIRDLVGIDFRPADDFPSDDVGEGFDNIGDVLSLPPLLLEKYLAAAETIVSKALEDDQARERILPHREGDGVSRREAARRNVRDFASRAFRRPATDGEVERLLALARTALDNGATDDEAQGAVLQAILVSPHFLFRVEPDPPPGEIRALNDYELASRLSYFLWSSMPDAALLQRADKGELRKPEVRREEIRRMLADPKARALVENFAGQWLQLRDLAHMAPDPKLFDEFDEELRGAMQRETELFFEAVVREDRSVLDFLLADFSYVNERLAKHYGMQGIEGTEFRRVSLSDRRRGVLTQASILALTSNPTRTSPVKRGKWILDNILGEPPSPPPAGVEQLDDDAETLGTLRERMEQHRSNESCAVCHRKMDTLGFGLENFDAIGAWRDRDGRFEIDPSGALPGGGKFAGPKELMQVLSESKRNAFCRCLAEKMLTYALGRGLLSHDRCAVDRIVKRLAEGEYRFGTLVEAIVESDPFILREAPDAD